MLETQKRTKTAQMSAIDGRAMLRELLSGLGYDAQLISVADLQSVADRLAELAGHSAGWGWRYLRNVLNGKIDASRKLSEAMLRLGAVIDETPEDLARSTPVTVMALGQVRAGALVLADSRRCANPGCRVEFVPRTPRQRCHSKECAAVVRKLRRAQKKNG